MKLFESLMVAISTYSIIPVPNFEWNEKNMKYAICFFPVVGVFCGLLMWGLYCLAGALDISNFFLSVIATCIPLVVTGGIHMDGFMDTVDALCSHQSKEKKLEILSDPHCGAFASIYYGVYLLMNLALVHEISASGHLLLLSPIFVLSRCISALCAVNLPNARKTGMLSSYTKDAKRIAVNITMGIVAVITSAIMICLSPVISAIAIISGLLWTVLYCLMVKKQFGGVTGDTAGFFLQLFELCCIIGVWIGAII